MSTNRLAQDMAAEFLRDAGVETIYDDNEAKRLCVELGLMEDLQTQSGDYPGMCRQAFFYDCHVVIIASHFTNPGDDGWTVHILKRERFTQEALRWWVATLYECANSQKPEHANLPRFIEQKTNLVTLQDRARPTN